MTGKSIALFVAAALAEIGGAYLVWLGLKEDKGASSPPTVASSLSAHSSGESPFDGFRPDRWDLIGAAVCLVGVGTIMYAPR